MNNEEEKQVQEECVEQGFGVEEALRCGDWELLRTLSFKPGGFGKERSSVWCVKSVDSLSAVVQSSVHSRSFLCSSQYSPDRRRQL